MIQKIDHTDSSTAKEIRNVFQRSYAVEAKLLKAKDFPPLKRSLISFKLSNTTFYSYVKNDVIAGVIEINEKETFVHIQSLVVIPSCFRKGIGKELMNYVLSLYTSNLFMVETGLANIPAIQLYKSLGFNEVKQWDTEIGIRKIRLEKSKNKL